MTRASRAQHGNTVRIESDGSVTAKIGATEQGEAIKATINQIAAEDAGVQIDKVRVFTGDALATTCSSSTWVFRGLGSGDEAALRAGLATYAAAPKVAGAMMRAYDENLDLADGIVVDKASRAVHIALG